MKAALVSGSFFSSCTSLSSFSLNEAASRFMFPWHLSGPVPSKVLTIGKHPIGGSPTKINLLPPSFLISWKNGKGCSHLSFLKENCSHLSASSKIYQTQGLVGAYLGIVSNACYQLILVAVLLAILCWQVWGERVKQQVSCSCAYEEGSLPHKLLCSSFFFCDKRM